MHTERVIKENIKMLKKIFIIEASKSGYPCITWLHYSNFCEDCEMVDKNLSMQTIDRIFKAADFDESKLANNPGLALQRYEFFEIIVRLA
jgi:hypothetical protein